MYRTYYTMCPSHYFSDTEDASESEQIKREEQFTEIKEQ